MKIQQFTNANIVVDTKESVILVDPMLGPKGSMPPFTLFRFKPRKNPLVSVPDICKPTLDRVTHCLITHKHPDHIDKAAERYLIERNTPVTCSTLDERTFRKKGMNVVQTVDYWEKVDFLGGKIEGIPARHGYGFIAKPAGNVMGFYIELPNEPSLYISSDTIYTEDVKKVFREYRPNVSLVAAGSAQFDVFKPLLMTMEDVVKFAQDAPGKVIANHLEAVNHCPTTRKQLVQKFASAGIKGKCFVPNDGEWMGFN
ncbi:MAG: MBL fold metallo-hydrolase [Cyanobacteria bacterium J06641_2]